jgi:hypothetical protein
MRIGDRHDTEKPRSVPWFTDKIGEFLQFVPVSAFRFQIPGFVSTLCSR